MLFIPLLSVYIALSLGRYDNRLTGKSVAMAIIPTLLFAAVMTNDLHQQMFAFGGGSPEFSGEYSYRPLYFVCLGWMIACMAFSLVRLFKKSRVAGGKKRMVPLIMGCVAVLYSVLYLSGIPAVRWWLGGYERDVLPAVCVDLRKLYTLSDDTVEYGLYRAF